MTIIEKVTSLFTYGNLAGHEHKMKYKGVDDSLTSSERWYYHLEACSVKGCDKQQSTMNTPYCECGHNNMYPKNKRWAK